MNKPHRDTVFAEQAEILVHQHCAGKQHILRVKAPRIAAAARAGSFAHITVDPQRPLRRPISIMRVDTRSGEVEFLYKEFGEGTRLLATREVGEKLSVLGPIGRPFELHTERPRPLLIGGGVGIPPMVFVAAETLALRGTYQPFVIMGSEAPFPFTPRPSHILVPGMAPEVIASMPLLEDWGIPSRLASRQGFAGCHDGFVTDVARAYLDALNADQQQEVEVFACGPHPMLEAVAALAREYRLPCQVSMEEFMACGIGGCAGCTIEVQTDSGPAMKRVCVDGPVFDARSVFPD